MRLNCFTFLTDYVTPSKSENVIKVYAYITAEIFNVSQYLELVDMALF